VIAASSDRPPPVEPSGYVPADRDRQDLISRAPGLCWRGVSGANEQQRDAGGRRGWWLVGSLAVSGAAVGAFGGYRLDPDVSELVPSLAVAGFGLGGLIGLLLLAPVGLWRAWRRRARRRAATTERADLSDGAGLWHTADPEREAAPASATELAGHGDVEAPTAEKTEPERPEEPAPGAGAEEAQALTPQEQPESEREEPGKPAGKEPGLEPEEPPPPAGEEPGWYPDPARDGVRRYWDGHAWTGHVWRGRARERTRKARNRR
jgi:hypothetical protein